MDSFRRRVASALRFEHRAVYLDRLSTPIANRGQARSDRSFDLLSGDLCRGFVRAALGSLVLVHEPDLRKLDHATPEAISSDQRISYAVPDFV